LSLMIKVENMHKSYGSAQLLKGISSCFDKGKTNLIIGQSGSGKTVSLHCLLGHFQPAQGRIIYTNQHDSEVDEDQQTQLRQEMGMVVQGSALFDSMTVIENVMFPLRMFTNLTREEMKDRAAMVLQRVNLVDADNKLPSEISGGM